MRQPTLRRAMIGALFFALAGCQLINGSYTLDSADSGDTNCIAVAICCGSLTGSQATSCYALAGLQNDEACATFLQGFPDGTCLSGPAPDGGLVFHDSGPPGTDATHPVRDSSSPLDAPTTGPLTGTWDLSEIECSGESLGVDGKSTLTFSGTGIEEVTTLTDDCVITTVLSPATVTATAITASNDTVTCSSQCTSTDCTPGDNGTFDEPYTLDGTTLTISDAVATTTCSTGTVTFTWTQD